MPSWRSYNPAPARRQRRFGLFPGRSPLLGESLIYFLFLGVLRCFSSPGSPRTVLMRCPPFERTGCPIRKSAGHRPFAPYRGLSQLITSFIASVSQGIRPAPFLTFFPSVPYSAFKAASGADSSYFQLYSRSLSVAFKVLLTVSCTNMSKIVSDSCRFGVCAPPRGPY